MTYLLHLLILINIYAILALSLNLLVGYTGLITLAHAAFYGIGAYVAALSMIHLGLSFLPSLFLAVGVTGLLSFAVGAVFCRYRGESFVLTTLAFQVITYSILHNWVSVTRGPLGISGIPNPSLFGMEIDSTFKFFLFSIAVSLVVFAILYQLMHSPFGRTLKAIRDDELAALALGKNVFLFRIKSFVIGSSIAAVAGALYATYLTYIDPTCFNLDEAILLLSMVIVGGTGNVLGPLIGAVVLVLLPEALRFLAIPSTAAPNARLMIYGLLVILLMRFRRRGIAGTYAIE